MRLIALFLLFYTTACGQTPAEKKSSVPSGKPTATTSVIATYPSLKVPNPGIDAPGEAFFFTANGSPAGQAPLIADHSKNAGPGESVILIGERLATDYHFWDGTELKPAVLPATRQGRAATEGTMSIVQVPAFAEKRIFVLWPSNQGNKGTPIRINAPEVFWIRDLVARGEKGAVYGKNLSFDTTTAYVFLKRTSNGAVYNLSDYRGVNHIKKVNPYKIEYTIPSNSADFPVGASFEVWVHTGKGGAMGWAKAPQSLTIYAGMHWSGTTIPVSGLTPNSPAAAGANTIAINKALATNAGQWRTLLLDVKGTIYINNQLHAQNQTRIKGNGKGVTILRSAPGFKEGARFLGGTAKEFQVEDLSIIVDNNFPGIPNSPKDQFQPIHLRGSATATHLVLKNIYLEARQRAIMDFVHRQYIYISGCEFVGKNIDAGQNRQVFFEHNLYKQADSALTCFISHAGREWDLSYNTWQDVDSTTSAGSGKGRFYTNEADWRGSYGIYFSYNTGISVGPHIRSGDLNQGEVFMSEGQTTEFSATPIEATSTSVAFSTGLPKSYTPATDIWYAHILKGKGAGQWRRIAKMGSKSFTTTEPWSIVPDGTSVVQVVPAAVQWVMYKNKVVAKSYIAKQPYHIASCGISTFDGNAFDWTSDGNQFIGMMYGMGIAGNHYNFAATSLSQTHINNRFEGCTYGIFLPVYGGKGMNGYGGWGYIFRGNTFLNSRAGDIRYQLTNRSFSPIIRGVVIEKNAMKLPVSNIEAAPFAAPSAEQVGLEVIRENINH